ncbi:hypothetical protein RvY_05369 [Ramazzottius varieornatus]|uniref:Uncharacterized protein n=1 Tax=Ramazzottius varieornatus TaxID=947166 RepID=A0A1D1UUR9_RAMVA|nr:hypothetical protein RvY_05369 [Ramazzottius varieornatus]
MAPLKKRRKANSRRWSRAVRDRPRRALDRAVSNDYTYDLNAAGEPMLSWAQAQQTVRLMRGHSTERFTIANELPLKYETSSTAVPREITKSAKKKIATALLSAAGSFEVVEALQKPVENVVAPPDDQQESYVCDEEDIEMLKIITERELQGEHNRLTVTHFENTITLLERESMRFRGTNSSFILPVDEDAVCSVCQKGDCDNTNMILFCDMCNLAVHQECYGVPYIPEGQWHCRRCMVSPSRPAQCVLCPNSEGALKQTEDGHWAHVICAMYIPGVAFKSTQLLEPIVNIETIEKSRHKLSCCICKKQEGFDKTKKVGVCIQCKEPACKVAFHVTCAQKAGYYMDLKPAKDDEKDSKDNVKNEDDDVEAIAYCEKHSREQPQKKDARSSSSLSNRHASANKAQQQNRMESLNIEPASLMKIAKEMKLDKRPKLFILILNYWKSKRRARNGLPLLKRPKGRNVVALRTANHEELETHRCMFKAARQQAEKLRTLIEYQLRKDKIDFKRDKLLDVRQGFEVMPAKNILEHVFDRIKAVDKDNYFAVPVTEKIAPKYFSIISHPMAFSTMAKKLEEPRAYSSFEEFEADVNLIINNCLKYNQSDTIFHRFALTFREMVKPMLEEGRRDYKEYVGRAREGTSLYQLTRLETDVMDLDDSPVSGKTGTEDDLLSEVSTTGDDLNGRDANVAEPNDFGTSPAQEDHLASTSSSSATCSSPAAHCRMIPSSPKSRKTPFPHELPTNGDTPKSDQSGPSRKRLRTASRSSEDNHASGSYVPTQSSDETATFPPVPTVSRTSQHSYRNGRVINNITSESELDGVFASEDSTDLPSSDYDIDSDSPLHRPMTRDSKRRLSSNLHSGRQWIDFRPGDLVWAKFGDSPAYPGFISDPKAAKGFSVKDGIFTIPAPPPDVLKKRNELNADAKCLVYFLDAARTWAWVPRDKLDFLLLDDAKDKLKLNESKKVKDKNAVRKAFDFAKIISTTPSAASKFLHVNGSTPGFGQG